MKPRSVPSSEYEKVSFICPVCQMTCGWNAKQQQFDAVAVESQNPKELQYAHRKCVADD